MNFSFNEEQLMFKQSVAELLSAKVTPEYIRKLWDSDTGRDADLWREFNELGLLTMCVPEDCNGLGLKAIDFVLIAEECGYVALPEELADTVLVTAPLLTAVGKQGQELVAKMIEGSARVAVGNRYDSLVDNAHIADWLLLPANNDKEAHLQSAKEVKCHRQESVDPSRRLFALDWKGKDSSCASKDAAKLWHNAHNMGALGAAAGLLGATRRMLDMAVAYTGERKQFSKPIGSFQAVKHMLADVATQLTFARPVLHYAAMVLSDNPANTVAVAHAKVAASQAASLAIKNCFQAHGAMGYTWEMDLQIFMKRAWALDKSWGAADVHKQHIHDALMKGELMDN